MALSADSISLFHAATMIAHCELRRYCVFVLAYSPERFDLLRAAGIFPLRGDLDDVASLSRIAGLARAIVHFAPPPKEVALTGELVTCWRRLINNSVP